HFLTGGSEFNSVHTDYFNVGAITTLINFDSPEGFSFKSTFKDIMNKQNLTEDTFNKYNTEHQVFSNKKISNDANYDFYAIGKAYENTTVTKQSYYGTYTDNELLFNGQNKPNSYAYIISLSGKGDGKEETVISAIKGKLNGYKIDEDKSTDGIYYYHDDNKEIKLFEKNGNIIIVVSSLDLDEEIEEYSY